MRRKLTLQGLCSHSTAGCTESQQHALLQKSLKLGTSLLKLLLDIHYLLQYQGSTRRVAIDYVHGTLLGVKIWKCLSINFVVWWATPWWTLVHWKVCKSSRKQICHHQASKLYFKAAKEPYWECGYLKASQLRSFLLLLITLLAWVIARNLGCLLFTWANWSVHGLDKRYAQFRTGKFHPRIAFTIATNQFHLPKNNRADLKPVSKMAFNKWNMDFCWEYTVRKKGLPFQMFHCSQKFPGGMIQKVVFHLLFNWILKKILVNGKQPYFQHYILLVEAIYI